MIKIADLQTVLPDASLRGLSWGFILAGATVPVAAMVSPHSVVPILVTASVIATWCSVVKGRARTVPYHGSLLLACLVVIGGFSCFWSISTSSSAIRTIQLAIEFILGIGLISSVPLIDQRSRRAVMRALSVGLILAALTVVADRLGDHFILKIGGSSTPQLFLFNKGASVLVLLLSSAAVHWWRAKRPEVTVALILIVFPLITTLKSDSAKVALIAIGVAGLALWISRAQVIRFLPYMLGSLVILLPVAAVLLPPVEKLTSLEDIKPSAAHRLIIWEFVGEKLRQKPVLGWGLDASRDLPGGKEIVLMTIAKDRPQVSVERLPLHPHNAILQIWVELGLPGAVVMFCLLIYLARSVSMAESAIPGVLTLIAGVIISLLSYGIWQSWWLQSLFMAIAVTRMNSENHLKVEGGG